MYGKNKVSITAPRKPVHGSSRTRFGANIFSFSVVVVQISFLAVLQEMTSRSFMDRETIVVHHHTTHLDTSKRLSCGCAGKSKLSCLHSTRTWKPATKLTTEPAPALPSLLYATDAKHPPTIGQPLTSS
jgi:hypothetical protein